MYKLYTSNTKYALYSLLLTLLFSVGCTAETSLVPTVDDDNIVLDSFSAEGTIPLVLIALTEPEGSENLMPLAVYQDLYIGRHSWNAQDYLLHASHGRFTFDFQGIYGPYDLEESGLEISDKFVEAVHSAHAEGFDFSRFDQNRDGVLETEELFIVVVDNGGPYGGAVRGLGTTLPNRLSLYMSAVIHGSHANLATIVHEITHLLGTRDLYGTSCNSQNLTLMSCTVFNRFGDDTVHLDPWHRIQLNWIEPRIIEIQRDIHSSHINRCYSVQTPQFTGSSNDAQKPLLIYDATRGDGEYFLIEFRNNNYFVPGFPSYDRNVPGYGIVIWAVLLDDNGFPREVPSLINPDGTDAALWAYGSNRDQQLLFTSFLGLDHQINLISPTEQTARFERLSHIWGPVQSVEVEWMDGTSAGFTVHTGNFSNRSGATEVCLEATPTTRDY